ncbi:MAG: hypothetical protein OFPII_20170 [Osedax symbiont Rs1]|nr:MAG: hypothetical protein OFPII_20170 [Osedax symbiont Rs1]
MMYLDRIEVIVIDDKIFNFFTTQLKNKDLNMIARFNQEVVLSRILPTLSFPFVFNSKQTRDVFNRGLNRIKATAKYKYILNLNW